MHASYNMDRKITPFGRTMHASADGFTTLAYKQHLVGMEWQWPVDHHLFNIDPWRWFLLSNSDASSSQKRREEGRERRDGRYLERLGIRCSLLVVTLSSSRLWLRLLGSAVSSRLWLRSLGSAARCRGAGGEPGLARLNKEQDMRFQIFKKLAEAHYNWKASVAEIRLSHNFAAKMVKIFLLPFI